MNQTDYNMEVSSALEDTEWDAFVAETPGGHHAQTSLWAQLKASLGWRSMRIIVRQQRLIIGGAQLLFRNVSLLGSVGYLTKGPLISVDDVILEDLIMGQIHQVSKVNHARYLVVQPPNLNNRQNLSNRMANWGFKESLMPFAPTPYTTLLIDLHRDLSDILSRMRTSTRRNIRLAERRGITVREGTEQDLNVFYRTLMATSTRQNFSEYPEEYWNRFHKAFSACGYAKIFLSEYKGEVVSSLLLVNFGDTVIYKKGGWMGNCKDLHPNDLLHWKAIQWAKCQGYHYYDFEGINSDAAKAIQREGSLPKAYQRTVTWYKLGFGGELTFYPVPFDYVYNPVLRWIYLTLFAKVRHRSDINYFINRFIRS